MRLTLVAGTTHTADDAAATGVDDSSVADTTLEQRRRAPSADAELVRYGRLVRASGRPTDPTDAPPPPVDVPTPAVVTRAVVDLLDLDVVVADGGLARPTGAPTVDFGAKPGRDVREADPVPTAPGAFAAASEFAERLDEDHLVVGATIPGGTTTAHAVVRALGEPSPVPSDGRRDRDAVAAAALAASELEPGEAAHHPELAVRFVGDPTLAVVAGLCVGALSSGARVTLAGGTPLVAAAALVRHAGRASDLELATTAAVAEDARLAPAVDALDLDLTVTDPGFDDERLSERDSLGRSGAAMGGALALASRAGVLDAVEDRALGLLDDLAVSGEGDERQFDGNVDREGERGS